MLLIAIVKSLSNKLNAPEWSRLETVFWLKSNSYAVDWPTWLRRNRLGLREELRGKLGLEDWRPLIASAMIYESRLRKKRLVSGSVLLLSSIICFIALVWLWEAFVDQVIPASAFHGNALGGVFLVFFFASFIVFAAITTPFARRLKISADKLANQELGNGSDLLRVLRLIETISIPQESRSMIVLSRKLPIPQRIKALNAMLDGS